MINSFGKIAGYKNQYPFYTPTVSRLRMNIWQ
jgi:hypothetical protein